MKKFVALIMSIVITIVITIIVYVLSGKEVIDNVYGMTWMILLSQVYRHNLEMMKRKEDCVLGIELDKRESL